MSDSDDLRKFEIRREMLVHEDYQLNARLGFHLTTQSILITASILLLNNQLLRIRLIGMLLLMIACVAVGLTLTFRKAVAAAIEHQEHIAGIKKMADEGASAVLAFEDKRYRTILQATDTLKDHGLAHVPWVVWIIVPIWLFMFTTGASLILDPTLISRVSP